MTMLPVWSIVYPPFASGHLHERHVDLLRKSSQRVACADDAGEVRRERRDVFRHDLRIVAIRIDRHEVDLQLFEQILSSGVGEFLLDLRQRRQRYRAHVGARREAEEQKRPVAVETRVVERVAVLVGEVERRDVTRSRQKERALLLQCGFVEQRFAGDLVYERAEHDGDERNAQQNGRANAARHTGFPGIPFVSTGTPIGT